VPVCSFPMATSETYRDRNTNEKITQTEWHNIVIWRKMAETAEKYLNKGSQVYIEGKLRTRSWEDQQGMKRYTTEIVADVMQLLDRPSGDRSGSVPHPAETAASIPGTGGHVQSSAAAPAAPASGGFGGDDPNLDGDLPF
jgi:single-strand DNA-binding protein